MSMYLVGKLKRRAVERKKRHLTRLGRQTTAAARPQSTSKPGLNLNNDGIIVEHYESKKKKDELSGLIENYKANIVAIQETRLWNNTRVFLPIFNEIRKVVTTIEFLMKL